jgi:hypothetical protein
MLQDTVVSSNQVAKPLATTSFLCALASLCWGVIFYTRISKTKSPLETRAWIRVRLHLSALPQPSYLLRLRLERYKNSPVCLVERRDHVLPSNGVAAMVRAREFSCKANTALYADRDRTVSGRQRFSASRSPSHTC